MKNKVKINESDAKFGFSILSEYIPLDRKKYKVLEIGSGSGTLLSMLSEKFKDIEFDGIEPFNIGFENNKKFKNINHRNNINVYEYNYEEHNLKKKYDLIFLINVFEHLNNWKHFLKTCKRWLNDDGKCIILCPNYNFPYESHFKIPIIYNKVITEILFKKQISKYENYNNSKGLWDSLNFVKKTNVSRYCKSLNIKLVDNINVLDILLDRFIIDEEFNKRQIFLGRIGVIIRKLKLLSLFRLPILKNYAPYMMLELTEKK